MKFKINTFGILIITLILNSCNTNQKIPTIEQITEIIIETIKQDSLDNEIPININLVNLFIYQPQYDSELGEIPPIGIGKMGKPFSFKKHRSTKDYLLGFNQEDSIFVVRQIKSNKNISLVLESIPDNIRVSNSSVDKNNELRLFQFYIPLFNLNNDFAVVEYDYQNASSGYGRIIYFKKINGKWTKVESFGTWMS